MNVTSTAAPKRIVLTLAFGLLLFAPFISKAQTTYYSRNGSALTWANNSFATGGHGGANCGCTPGNNDYVVIGNNHTFTYNSTNTARTIARLTINNGTFVFGSNTTNTTTFSVSGDVTVNTGGTFRSGNTGTRSHTFRVGGDLANDGTIDFNNGTATNQTIVFNANVARTVSGTGTFDIDNFTLDTNNDSDLNVNIDIPIIGTLNFAANGLIVLGPNNNITLGSAATITGTLGTARHIQVDGTTGANSQLIRVTTASTTPWRFLFPIGTATGGYTPVSFTAATITTAPDNNGTLAVKSINTADVAGSLKREFRLTVAGNNNATTLTDGSFSYNTATDLSTGDIITDYTQVYYQDATTGGAYVTVTGTSAGSGSFTGPGTAKPLSNGSYYYTIGIPPPPETWYTYQTGVWNNPDNWTQDPTGTTLVNPFTESPGNGDMVVILNGYTMTANVNNLALYGTKIEGGGVLDMAATTGQNLGTVSGTGLLRVNGIALPAGTYTSFVASTGGTIEYYNAGGTLTLPASQATYNHLLLSNNTGSAANYVTVNNLTINGNLNVTQTGGAGTVTWQINDNSANRRTLTIYGDITVSANGRIRAGTGNEGTNAVGDNAAATQPHDLFLYGNLTNNGSIKFFDATDTELEDADYTSRAVFTEELQGNAVSVTFTGVTDNTVTCNNQTDFYRFILNKGNGQQPLLTVTSTNTSNFRLFGPANLNFIGATPTTTSVSENALSIQNGTLKLTGSINIPTLAENGLNSNYGYPIPQAGALWLADAGVTVQVTHPTTVSDNGRPLLLFGLLRISNGSMKMGYSRGLLGGGSGVLLMEDGLLEAYQLRTAQLTAGNNFAYIQSGGVVNIGTAGLVGVDVINYPRFALSFSTCTFKMSGGELNIGNPINGGTADEVGMLINAATGNIEVTGGEVNVHLPASNVDFIINSNAPFYDFNIEKPAAGGTSTAIVTDAAYYDVPTASAVTVAAKPLVILNNLVVTTANSPTLNASGNNVTVGGNLDVQSGATFTPGTNTITFNGSGAQSWTNNGTISNLNNIIVNKGGTLTLGGTNAFPNAGSIAGLTLTAGTLNDGGKTLTVTTTLSNSAVHTGTGVITGNGITTIAGINGTFGNLNINTNATVVMNSNQTVTGNLRLLSANSTLNIGSDSLVVLGGIFANTDTVTSTFSATKRILMNGLRNDGGLTRKATSNVNLIFPVGTSVAAYSPITIKVVATTTGTVTVRPVKEEHPNVTTTGQSLRYYWRVTSAGFSGITLADHKKYTFNSAALLTGTTTAYRPACYNAATFSWTYGPAYNAGGTTVIPSFNPNSGWAPSNNIRLDGEFTTGTVGSFNTVTVFYSRQTGNWNVNTTWSTSPCTGAGACGAAVGAGTFPAANNPVVIGDASNNHIVTIDANGRTCGSLYLSANSTLDCGTRTGLDFGVNTTGTGKLRIASAAATAAFPGGDFTNFLGAAGGTVEYYGATTIIPTNSSGTENIVLDNYYNLIVSPNTGATITLPASNLTLYNDLTISGITTGQVNTNETVASRNIAVNGNLNISSGRLSIRNGFATILTLQGDATIANGASVLLEGGGTATHPWSIGGSVTNNGTMTLRNVNEVVNLTFTSAANESFTGTNAAASTTLNGLTVNKGTSQTAVLTFDVAGTVTTLTNNWLTLTNGTLNFNKAGQTFILTDVVDVNYTIASTAKLSVQSGTVTIGNSTDNADNADLLLAGALEVAGGTVNIGRSDEDNDSDIEYASAGTPTITVSGGTLYVNGQIRRSTSTLAGALRYIQTNGAVTVAGRSADNTRGVFEIENYSGSNFTMAGTSSLTIARPSGGTQYADLYLNPETTSIAPGSVIYIGSNTLGAQALDINIIPTIADITILGANSNAQTVDLQSNPLNVAGTLTIDQASRLNANALNVTIGGNLAINTDGIYNGSANTTIFNGSGAQAGSLSSNSTFQNVTVNKPVGTLTLSGTSPTITNLNHLSGILDVTTIGLAVNGNIVINSAQVGTGSITLSGSSTTHTITSSGGSFTNLAFSNTGASTKVATVEGNLTINGQLSFATNRRYLAIGDNLLTFGSAASIQGANSTAFIRTFGIAGDLGVARNWPAGASTFTYEVGVGTSHTPIAFTLNVSAPGTLTIAQVNQAHPTRNVGSTERILNHYWIVTRDGSLTYTTTGSHVYTFPDVLMGGTLGTLVAGLLDVANPTGWITNSTTHGGTANTTSMTYTNLLDVNLPTTGNLFHYTVGTVNTLPNPIVPVYSRFADADMVSNPTTAGNLAAGADWNNPSSWTTSSTGYGAALASAPTGVPVVILANARINMNVNARTAFTTSINGLLVLGNSFAHNLGILSGTGTMRTATNTFPAGNYTAYVSGAGGTIEYVAPMTMNARNTYNNLSIYGTSGTVTMTNTNLVLNGSLTIPAGTTLSNTVNNRNITIAGHWANAGTFAAGTGTVTFNGAATQNISGTTTFNNVTISKTGGNVSLQNTSTVNGVLTLTNRHIVVSAGNNLNLPLASSISGGSANSFIAGQVNKTFAAGGFSFPVGSVTANRYRPVQLANTNATDTWQVTYFPNDPTADLIPNESLNTTNLGAVSNFEYWMINRTSARADVTLSYNTGSYRSDVGNVGNVANLRIARWSSGQWDLPPGSGSFSQSGNDISGTVTVTNVTNFSPFTLASLDLSSPLPVTWLSFGAARAGSTVVLNWKTAQEIDNDRFEIERSINGIQYQQIGIEAGKGNSTSPQEYKFIDAESSLYNKYYYRIKQVDVSGEFHYSNVVFISAEGEAQQRWAVYPNPVKGNETLKLKQLSASDTETIKITLASINGTVLYESDGSVEDLSAALEQRFADVGAGLYLIQVSHGYHREVFKIVKH